jgi:hypothetical protein
MASSPIVDRPCALKILGFTLGTILEMRGSTWGFSPGFVTWKKILLKSNIRGNVISSILYCSLTLLKDFEEHSLYHIKRELNTEA